MANELGRLAQGVRSCIKGTNTIHFIAKHTIPKEAIITYACIVPNYWPLKDKPYCTRLMVGGNKLSYDNNTKTDVTNY